jgi:hypothetical protein
VVDPVAAAALAHTAGTNARAARQNARSTASNVILVATSTPRRGGGYKIEFEIYNKSAIGIADIVVDVHMLSGDLELNAERGTHGTWSARRALEAGGTLAGALRHTARFGEETFELDDDVLSSFSCTLSWCDDQRRKWSRVDGKPARRILPMTRQRPSPR